MLSVRNVAAALLIAAMAVRLYAAWDAVTVCSWDDSMYREQAMESPLSLPEVVRRIMLPTTENRVSDKTMGYYLWLVMGLRAWGWLGTPSDTYGCSVSTTERAWQIVNVTLLLIQLACVYGIARWALQDNGYAFAVTACYLMSPIVFGMNRWVMTENHVMAGLWMAIAMTILVTTVRHPLVPPIAAVGIGMFAALREYALPLIIVLVLVACAALLRDRRYAAAAVFATIALSYLGSAVVAATPVIARALEKVMNAEGQVQFFNPFPAWLWHMLWESWGPSLAVLWVAGGTWVAIRFGRMVRAGRAHLDGLALLWIGLGLLCIATLAGAYLTVQRLVRPSIPPFLFGLAFALVGWRVTGLRPPPHRAALSVTLAALVASAGLLAYHLFIRFDQGRSYQPHAAYMEYYDHPLWLRPTGGQYDRHFY